jgi:serine/threonine-protein kinase
MKALAANPTDRYPTVEAFRDDLVRFLQGGGWFSSRTFSPGEHIVKESEHADAAYIITGGICEVYRADRGRKEWLRTLGPGDVFGETAIFAAEPRTASVQAVTAVTAIQVTRDSLEQELGLQSWVGAFVKALALRFRDLDREVVVLRHARIAGDLLSHALAYVALQGKDVKGGREARWKPLAAELVSRSLLSEPEIAESLAGSGRLDVEPLRDRVLLRAGA